VSRVLGTVGVMHLEADDLAAVEAVRVKVVAA
jgi:hypothetical protein